MMPRLTGYKLRIRTTSKYYQSDKTCDKLVNMHKYSITLQQNSDKYERHFFKHIRQI
jgi:hypothetical protein